MESTLQQLRVLSEEVFQCTRGCAGISCDGANGMRPRGPRVEGGTGEAGVIIVGLNPGQPDANERGVLTRLSSHADYEAWSNAHNFQTNAYWNRLRGFARDIGFRGPIVWSNVAKCESAVARTGVPLETQRRCAQTFLTRELSLTPTQWPVIAAGRDAYVALTYLALERPIVGVPHPTGASPQFHRLLSKENGGLKPELLAEIEAVLRSTTPASVWLTLKSGASPLTRVAADIAAAGQ
jgi:uracil-DNA glycosylase